jgi:hypothetical protein
VSILLSVFPDGTSPPHAPSSTLTNLIHDRFLLYPAFTPFIVVFIHTTSAFHHHPTTTAPSTSPSFIAPSTTTNASTTADLALLHAVVNSLADLRTVSNGATRLHDICAALLAVADILSEAHNGHKAQNSIENGTVEYSGISANNTDPAAGGSQGISGIPASNEVNMSLAQGLGLGQGVPVQSATGGAEFVGMNGGDIGMGMGDLGDLGDLSDLDKLFGTWFGANRPMTDIFNAGFDFEGGGDMF